MKAYIVTGANKGIGQQSVRRILSDIPDSFVFLGARNIKRGNEAVEGIKGESKDYEKRIALLQVDVTDLKSIDSAFEFVKEYLKNNGDVSSNLEALVNNAGAADLQTMKQNFDLNARGAYNMTTTFAPLLRKGGRVVNVTSSLGVMFAEACNKKYNDFFKNEKVTLDELNDLMKRAEKEVDNGAGTEAEIFKDMGGLEGFNYKGETDVFYYSFSKTVLNSFTIILQREHPDLMVNCCCPGWIPTDLSSRYHGFDAEKIKSLGMNTLNQGTISTMTLLTTDKDYRGMHLGNDGKRSPMHFFRTPGTEEYKGE